MTSLEARCVDCRNFKAQGATMSGKNIKEHMIHNSNSASGFFSPIRIRTLKSRIRQFFALFTQKVPT